MFDKPTVIAHRGISAVAPENTLPAFELAAAHGVKWIETDVDIIADGTPILMHDSTLERTTNRSGGYTELVAADLVGIDAGAWFGPEFAHTPIPTLAQLVDFMNRTGMNANIELKSNECGAQSSRRQVDVVIEHLQDLKPGIKVIISSFNHLLLEYCHRQAPDLEIGALFEPATLGPDWRSICELVGASHIHPCGQGLTPERVADFKGAGLGVNVWTVNNIGLARTLFGWGVDAVFTDIAHLFDPQYH